jgi:hypothetical protein
MLVLLYCLTLEYFYALPCSQAITCVVCHDTSLEDPPVIQQPLSIPGNILRLVQLLARR